MGDSAEELATLAGTVWGRLVETSVLRASVEKRSALQDYFEKKGGLYRQLTQRLLLAQRRALSKTEGLPWAIAELRQTVLTRASSEQATQKYSDWFVQRMPMLMGMSSQLWELALDTKTGIVPSVSRKLLLSYLTVPLAVEASAAKRTEGNLAAIKVLSSGRPLSEDDRTTLAGYTGWGGLSIDKVLDRLPAAYTPDSSALIHEFFTPPMLCVEVARVMKRYLEPSAAVHTKLLALEPSAGIGRFIHALTVHLGPEKLDWTAVEYSGLSSTMLRAMRPDIRVVEGSFERFIAQEEDRLSGRLHLVVSNPPYGERGASSQQDPNPDYQVRKAYVYFLLRCLNLLAPSGFGVFVIPYGFLTGQSAELTALRKRVLKRHHLMAAFRLPSSLFPGANIVTDLLFFRARGGELSEVAAEDDAILAGRYFDAFPAHLLGQEISSTAPDVKEGRVKKPRLGYEVLGTFTRLPDFEERPLCTSCAQPTTPVPAKIKKSSSVAEFLLPVEIQTAISLGKRVNRYLGLISSTEEKQIELAQRQHTELLTALTDLHTRLGESPRQSRALREYAKERAEIRTLLSVFTDSGDVVLALQSRPNYKPRYQGRHDDLTAQASFLFRTERTMTMAALIQFRQSLGVDTNTLLAQQQLAQAGWAVDGEQWLPEQEYYTGSLWPRYDRAISRSQGQEKELFLDVLAAKQAARLLEVIGTVTLSAIEPDPRLPWVPLPVVQLWIASFTGVQAPQLERRNYLVVPVGVAGSELFKDTTQKSLSIVLGFINHDYLLFTSSNTPKEVDPTTGSIESDSSALSRWRLSYEEAALRSFTSFLQTNSDLAAQVTSAYNRTFRGYIEPTYTEFTTPTRWGTRVTLRKHQEVAAARLLAHLGGLLGFDVGVGKTFTGIATIARLREEGKARRPVVVVPNSLLYQWLKQFQSALPDYRVLVIGAERYVGRSGALVSRTDKAEERLAKWRTFQAGGADAVICSYTTFAGAVVSPESRAAFVWGSPPMLKLMGLQARAAAVDADETDNKGNKKKRKPIRPAAEAELVKRFGAQLRLMSKQELERAAEDIALNQEREREADRQRVRRILESLSDVTERERAIIQNRIERWASLEEEGDKSDGVFWEELGVDALFVDEAQNFKNLWPVHRGTEALPKYLGGIQTPTQRALDFAIRAFLVRKKNGGSGVYLLSATPAKNSPIEYFSLLSLVDGDAWSRLGVTDPSDFIARYLKIERKQVLDTNLKEELREVVVGFRNIPELKDILFRFAEFRTAAEVGLKLPISDSQTLKVPMSEAQSTLHTALLQQYRALITDRSAGARNKALGSLMQMAMVSVHPGLVEQRPEKGWSRSNWNVVRDYSSPKLEYCAAEVVKKLGCGHIVFVESVAAHYWLRELLVAKGVRRERIAILNAEEAPTALRRQVIAEQFNGTPAILDDSGNVEVEAVLPAFDVVIANSVAYEGTDLHIRTCMVHHMDLPWEPATLQQRNGRAVRQGNTQAVIAILYYVSQGSIDAARLAIILGKLTWMKDILSGSDRETNNPAAGSELSQDELVAFLYSPEELSTLRAAMAKRQEEEDRRAGRRRAWSLAKRIYEHLSRNKAAFDQDHNAARELKKQLLEIPQRTWPWQGTLLKYLLEDVPCAFLDLRRKPSLASPPTQADSAEAEEEVVTVGLWERAVFSASTEPDRPVQFQVGKVLDEGVSVRLADTVEWRHLTSEALNQAQEEPDTVIYRALRRARPENFDSAKWNTPKDKLGIEKELTRALSELGRSGISALGMKYAPDGWRLRLWTDWSVHVLPLLGGKLLIPREIGPLLVRAAPTLAQSAPAIPWTDAGFGRFVQRAKEAGDLTWTELNAASLAWFERPFPKGILGRAKDLASSVEITLESGVKQSTPLLWMQDGLAVTQLSAAEWAVTHLASGRRISGSQAPGFPSAAMAQRVAEWLLQLPTDWEQSDTSQLFDSTLDPRRVRRAIDWALTQPRLPTNQELQRYFQSLAS